VREGFGLVGKSGEAGLPVVVTWRGPHLTGKSMRYLEEPFPAFFISFSATIACRIKVIP
jgi:hypothetical protein